MIYDNLRNVMKERISILEKLITELERKISQYPSGRIRINRKGNGVYYYVVDNSTGPNGKPLKESDKNTIEKLLQKSYFQKVVTASNQELKALRHALAVFPDASAEEVFSNLPAERQNAVKPIVSSDEKYIENWLSQPYTPKEFKEGTAYYETLKGERVRSKSEQIIADRLAANNIPYKYECPLRLIDGTVYPDFTILRLSDRQEVYFEHNGRMDDPGYAEDKANRTNRYILSGIYPGKRLIQLFETKDVPLNVKVLDKLINDVFR